MQRKSKMIFVIWIAVMMLSFAAPKIVLNILEDHNLENLYKPTSKLVYHDTDNAIIKTIFTKYNNIENEEDLHLSVVVDTYDINVNVSLSIDSNDDDLFDKILDLQNIGIIKDTLMNDFEAKERVILRINEFKIENIHYSKIRFFLSDQLDEAFMSYETEDKTGKIIAFKIPKKYIHRNKDLLKSYIQYLELEDDSWIYEQDRAYSTTYHIEIKIEEIHDILSLTIIPYYK